MNAELTIINSNCPTVFFGVAVSSIRTEEDALNAIKNFCEMAPAEVIEATTDELKTLAEVNYDLYQVINNLIWKTELELGSYAWNNRFRMLNASLK